MSKKWRHALRDILRDLSEVDSDSYQVTLMTTHGCYQRMTVGYANRTLVAVVGKNGTAVVIRLDTVLAVITTNNAGEVERGEVVFDEETGAMLS